MYVVMSWRNVWRNPRRTAVILAAVIIGVWAMLFLGGVTRGMMESIFNNGISTLTGHLQVHAEGYRDDPVIDHTIEDPTRVREAMERELPAGSSWTTRIRVNAVVSNARNSTGVTLVGIEPDREAKVSFIGGAVREGEYLAADDALGVVIGKALADKFGTEIGRKLVVMSQDTTGEIASRAFLVRGIYRSELEATEKAFIFVTLGAAREMLQAGDGVSEVAALLPDRELVDATAGRLQGALAGTGLEVSTWKELEPALGAQMRLVDWSLYIWYVVVFVAMAFGIVNTLLMAVLERMREFGLLKALGLRPSALVSSVLLESLLLLAVGMAAGSVLGAVTVVILSSTGIDLTALAAGSEMFGMSRMVYPHLTVQDVVVANGVVLVLGLLVSLYPAVKAARFLPVEALRSV